MDGLRRSTRDRKSTIIESDTLPTPSPPRRKAAQPPKLNTARTRLRDDIAKKTKAKAENFLVANKDFFLPLLPKNTTSRSWSLKAKRSLLSSTKSFRRSPRV